MANRVIQFSQSAIEQKKEDSKEVYLDISMQAKPTTVSQHYTVMYMPQLSDCCSLLGAENSEVSVATEQTLANIALFADDSYSKPIVETAVSSTQSFQASKLVNVNAIKNSIHNIFSWTPGERILNPEFGSNLRKLLYEGITDFNQEQIIAEIRHSVSQWEPRVQIDNIVKLTSTEDKEDNTVHLRIIYSIPSLTTEQFYYDYDANAPG